MFFIKKKESVKSPTGVNLVGNPKYNRGNVLLGLLARGLAVFLIVYGSIGCFVSSLNIEYNELLVVGVLLILSFYLAFIFYRPWIKNLGYILILFIFIFGVGSFAMVINSGFYALVNIFLGKVEIALALPGVMEYTEQISNRVYSVTVALTFLGAGTCVLVNMFISNVMSIVRTIIITLPIAIIGSYIGLKPNVIYGIFLLSGYLLVYVMKRSGHYRGNGKNEEFRIVNKKNISRYIYHSDGKIMIQLNAFLMVIAILFTIVILLIFPNGNIKKHLRLANFRNDSDYVLSSIAMSGLSGLFDSKSGAGGMEGGMLGKIGDAHPDYQTDLIVKLIPYGYDTVYLRGFIGSTYNVDMWYANTGSSLDADEGYEYKVSANKEYNQLKEGYENDIEGKMKSKMAIENVGANTYYSYLPYYSQVGEDGFTSYAQYDLYYSGMGYEETYYIDYYPYNDKAEYHNEIEVDDIYLEIPDENIDVIREFCETAGFQGTDEEIEEQVKDYFQENIPYTLKPGKLPRNENFVNYFLTKNKKGYCSHFATAATLIFRYYGIPARYIEGYAVSYESIIDGDIIEGADYNNWFSGDNQLGETALVEVEVDDSKAHAWVEVYDPDFGWRVVEVTPYAFLVEDEDSDFWSFFGEGINFNGNTGGNGQGFSEFSIGRFGIAIFILLGLLLIYILYRVIKNILILIKRRRGFNTKDYNTNIVNLYAYLCSKIRQKNKEFDTMSSHSMQIGWMVNNCEVYGIDEERIVKVLQQASYSNETIDNSDYEYVRTILLGMSKKLKFIK